MNFSGSIGGSNRGADIGRGINNPVANMENECVLEEYDSVDITYEGERIQMRKLDVGEQELRALFPSFPRDRVMILKTTVGDVCTVTRYKFSMINKAAFLTISVGPQLVNAEMASTPPPGIGGRRREYFPVEYRSEPEYNQRPLAPMPFAEGNRRRSHGTKLPRMSEPSDIVFYLKVRRGELTRAGKVIPATEREVKNISGYESHFNFAQLLDDILTAFKIEGDDRERFKLVDKDGNPFGSDMATESFNFWQTKAKSSAKMYLVNMGMKKKPKKRQYDSSESDSDESRVTPAYGRAGDTSATSAPVPTSDNSGTGKRQFETVNEELQTLRRTLAEEECSGTYLRDVNSKLRATEMKRLSDEIKALRDSVLEGEPAVVADVADVTGNEAAPTMETILAPLRCKLCGDFMVEPQQCPKCRMVCGGRVCVLKWFLTEMQEGHKKRCPSCNSEILDTVTDRNMSAFAEHVKEQNLRFQYCTP